MKSWMAVLTIAILTSCSSVPKDPAAELRYTKICLTDSEKQVLREAHKAGRWRASTTAKLVLNNRQFRKSCP